MHPLQATSGHIGCQTQYYSLFRGARQVQLRNTTKVLPFSYIPETLRPGQMRSCSELQRFGEETPSSFFMYGHTYFLLQQGTGALESPAKDSPAIVLILRQHSHALLLLFHEANLLHEHRAHLR